MKTIFLLAVGLTTTFAQGVCTAQTRVLVYTRNHVTTGGGYVHDNIASSVDAIKKIGTPNGFLVDVSDDPSVFNDPNLKKYKTLIFSNSTTKHLRANRNGNLLAFPPLIRAEA